MTPSSVPNQRPRRRWSGARRVVLVVVILVAIPPGVMRAQTPAAPAFERASRQAIVEAMLAQKQQGYDVLATANGARFSAGIILRLARRARERSSEPPPILIDHRDYFEAFLEVTGLEAARAPVFIRIANEYGEDQFIDARRDHVIERIVQGPEPDLAVNVVAGWPDGPGVPSKYSYTDDASRPPLRVTHKRVTRYRILDLGDRLLYDDIQGIYGRATGGLLGLMFSVIGDGRAVRSFMALSSDGLQITRTTASKLITVTQTATVSRDGKGEKGLPPNRPDLVAIEQRLKQPFEAKYVSVSGVDPSSWSVTR